MHNDALILSKTIPKACKYLDNNTKKNCKYKKKWKPWTELTYEEKIILADKESIKDELRQVRIFLLILKDFKNNPKTIKNLDFNKKFLSNIQKPHTPHNTSQFLTSTYYKNSNNSKELELEQEDPKFIDDVSNRDIPDNSLEFCEPGGSMKCTLKKLTILDDIIFKNTNEDYNSLESWPKSSGKKMRNEI